MEYYRDNFRLHQFKSSINIRLLHETGTNREDLVEFDIDISSRLVRYLHPPISNTHIVEDLNFEMSFKELINILLELILEDYSEVQYYQVPRFNWQLFYESGEHWSFVLSMLESDTIELVSWIEGTEGAICMSVDPLDSDSTIRQVLEQCQSNMRFL